MAIFTLASHVVQKELYTVQQIVLDPLSPDDVP